MRTTRKRIGSLVMAGGLAIAGHGDAATPPGSIGVRNAHAMTYDATRRQIVLFGGADAASVRGDTWGWDGRRWTPLATRGPAPRTFPAMAFDERRAHTILFGGRRVLFGRKGQPDTFLGDTWAFDGRVWRELHVTGPAPRAEAAMTYDALRGRIVLFGGYNDAGGATNRLGDTWEWDGEAWHLRAEAGPRPRNGASIVFDPGRGECVLFGGSGGPLADTWTWDGSRWRELSVEVPGRFNAAAAWDVALRAVLRFGGWNGRDRTADTFLLGGSGWRAPTVSSPPPPRNHAALAYDSRRKRGVLFGGHDGDRVFGDTWEWDGRGWQLCVSTAPQGRIPNDH